MATMTLALCHAIFKQAVRGQAVAQEARFACVRRLTEFESQQRYAFLEGALQTLAAHVRCANRSSEVRQLALPIRAVHGAAVACTAECQRDMWL